MLAGSFSTDKLLRKAEKITGLFDFGSDHPREGLAKLVEGINARTDVIESRRGHIEQELLRLLTNRLWRQKDFQDHPEILNEKLLPPINIVGMPRTGSTKLQRILGATDRLQSIPFWRIHCFARIPGTGDGGIARRIAETQRFCDWRVGVIPTIQQTHAMAAEEPEEEAFIMEAGFRALYLGLQYESPQYLGWLAQQDMTLAYDFLKQQLQYVQWQFHRDDPKPFLLKAPGHLGFEDQLQRIYPGWNKMIFSHRAPAEVFGSACLLLSLFRRLYFNVDSSTEHFGKGVLATFVEPIKRHLAWRDSEPSVEILDLGIGEISNDSLGTAEKIYNFIDEPMTDEVRENLRAWDKKNPRYKHGKSEYSLADFGLTEADVNDAYAPYIERFSQYF